MTRGDNRNHARHHTIGPITPHASPAHMSSDPFRDKGRDDLPKFKVFEEVSLRELLTGTTVFDRVKMPTTVISGEDLTRAEDCSYKIKTVDEVECDLDLLTKRPRFEKFIEKDILEGDVDF